MLILDIGGEGRHAPAVNLNRSTRKTIGRDRGQPIPNLIVGRAEAIPLADRSVDCVIVERTPLRRQAILEIARVLRREGTVRLMHVVRPGADRHALARQLLGGTARRRVRQWYGQFVQETWIRLD